MAALDAEKDKWGAEVYPWKEILVGDSRTLLLVLLGSVGMVLLIGCVNIANLLLARSASRQREILPFVARWSRSECRSFRQLLTKAFCCQFWGGAGGKLLSRVIWA